MFYCHTFRFQPSDIQLEMWARVLKRDPGYGPQAWRTNTNKGAIKKWTSHPSAAPFTAPKPDSGLVPLVFQDQKDLEKQLSDLQLSAGGMGAVSTRFLGLIKGKLGDHLKQYILSNVFTRKGQRLGRYCGRVQG